MVDYKATPNLASRNSSSNVQPIFDRVLSSCPGVLLIFFASFYCLMFQKYRAYDIDNSWFLSFSYNLSELHIEKDTFAQVPFPLGMDGTSMFGKFAAYVQSAALMIMGWTPRAASFVSIAFTVASLGLWWAALRKWGYSRNLVAGFILLLGISEPVVSMAEKFRYEFFSFFLLSLALWLAANRHAFLSLLVAFLAVETQPIAILVPVIIFALLISRVTNRRRLVWQACAAAVLALAVYLALHPHGISAMAAGLEARHEKYQVGGTLFAYFGKRLRHLPELIVLAVGAWFFYRRRAEISFPGIDWIAWAIIVLFFLMPHPNVSYMVFLLPFLLLIAVLGFERDRRFLWMPICLACIILAQYGYLFHRNYHEGISAADIARVSAMIRQSESELALNDAKTHIVGDLSVWFAHPYNYSVRLEVDSGDLYLCYSRPLEEGDLAVAGRYSCNELRGRLPVRTISEVTLNGHTLYLLANKN